jgi:ferredoxin-thioredoxin reductase catalytic chain
MPKPKTPKTPEDARKFFTMVAKKQGWHLNRDDEFLQDLAEGFATVFNRFGYFSCPCRDADGILEEDKDIICPCDYCRPDQAEFGHCYCGLYLTPDFYETGKEPQAIPERRE